MIGRTCGLYNREENLHHVLKGNQEEDHLENKHIDGNIISHYELK
jgi:hypothetical protein